MDNPINKRVDKMNGEQLDFPPNGLSIDLLRAVYRNPSIPLPVIPDGLQVLHKCDVPRCINPVHLFLGTQQNNIDDMLAKGGYRPWRGGRPRFIMPEQVAKMAMLRRQGHSYASI